MILFVYFKLKNIINEQSKTIEKLNKSQFRVGDTVYISDGKRNPNESYFLIEEYNNGECYYIGKSMDFDHKYSDLINGVHISNISNIKPPFCSCCGKPA